MESRIRNFLLAFFYGAVFITITPLQAAEENTEVAAEEAAIENTGEATSETADTDEQETKPVIQPEVERMTFEESRINPDNFEIIASTGLMSIEDFGTSLTYSVKLAYRISEGFFMDAEYGAATAGETSSEILLPGAPLLSDDERNLRYYLLNIGYDIFPGETFVTRNTTYNSAFYLLAGIGNTKFAGSDNLTLSFGYGYRVLFADFLSVYFEARDHTFKMDLLGEEKLTHNLAINFGMGFYF